MLDLIDTRMGQLYEGKANLLKRFLVELHKREAVIK